MRRLDARVLAAKPEGYETDSENRVLLVLERVGEVPTVAAALVFPDTNLRSWSPWSWWLVAAVALMIVYEAGWIRYFASPRTMLDFYRSLGGVLRVARSCGRRGP
jgi:hypothetical protein